MSVARRRRPGRAAEAVRGDGDIEVSFLMGTSASTSEGGHEMTGEDDHEESGVGEGSNGEPRVRRRQALLRHSSVAMGGCGHGLSLLLPCSWWAQRCRPGRGRGNAASGTPCTRPAPIPAPWGPATRHAPPARDADGADVPATIVAGAWSPG